MRFNEMVAKMPFLEQAYTKFLDCLPPIKGPLSVTKTASLRKKRGHGSGIVVVDCLLILPSDGIQLLDYLWVYRFFHSFLGIRMFYGHRPAAGFLGVASDGLCRRKEFRKRA